MHLGMIYAALLAAGELGPDGRPVSKSDGGAIKCIPTPAASIEQEPRLVPPRSGSETGVGTSIRDRPAAIGAAGRQSLLTR